MVPDSPQNLDVPWAVVYRPAAFGCARCGGNAGSLPAAARFCPKCGTHLEDDRSAVGPVARLAAIRQAEGWLSVAPRPSAVSANGLEAAEPLPQTSILRGYAVALYNLARRYERGRGVHRNPAEAIRCFTKSARLGHVDAARRLEAGRPPAPDTRSGA